MRWGDGQSPKIFCRIARSAGGAEPGTSVEEILLMAILMAIAAILSGANGWNEIEDYAQSKVEWFESFLRLPGGVPSHDTFNRVFSALDP